MIYRYSSIPMSLFYLEQFILPSLVIIYITVIVAISEFVLM